MREFCVRRLRVRRFILRIKKKKCVGSVTVEGRLCERGACERVACQRVACEEVVRAQDVCV